MILTEKKTRYHSLPFRADVLTLFRQAFPVRGRAVHVYTALLEEAVANPKLQELIKTQETVWDSKKRGFIQVGDRADYDRYLELMGASGDDLKSVAWNSLLLKAFLEHDWVRHAVGKRLLGY